jgi:DNA-binding CsgD family transcriptional regulator
MPPRIPDHIRQAIIDDYVKNPVAYLTLANRHDVSQATVGKILHDAGVIDPVKARRRRARGFLAHPGPLGAASIKATPKPISEYDRVLLRFLADGLKSWEIAREVARRKLRPATEDRQVHARFMGAVNPEVIDKDLGRLYKRLGARDRAHAVGIAYQKGILGVACKECGHDPATTPSPSGDASDSGY